MMTLIQDAPAPVSARAPYTPQNFFDEEQSQKKRNVAAFVLSAALVVTFAAGVLVTSNLTGTISEREATIKAQVATIAGLEDDVTALESDVETATAEAALCRSEAVAWNAATLALATDVSNWLGAFPFGEIDLSASSTTAEAARAIGCTE